METLEDRLQKLDGISNQAIGVRLQIVDAARAVVPVLLDAGRTHSAKQLQELFFQLDAIEQQIKDIVLSDVRGVVGAMVERRIIKK